MNAANSKIWMRERGNINIAVVRDYEGWTWQVHAVTGGQCWVVRGHCQRRIEVAVSAWMAQGMFWGDVARCLRFFCEVANAKSA